MSFVERWLERWPRGKFAVPRNDHAERHLEKTTEYVAESIRSTGTISGTVAILATCSMPFRSTSFPIGTIGTVALAETRRIPAAPARHNPKETSTMSCFISLTMSGRAVLVNMDQVHRIESNSVGSALVFSASDKLRVDETLQTISDKLRRAHDGEAIGRRKSRPGRNLVAKDSDTERHRARA